MITVFVTQNLDVDTSPATLVPRCHAATNTDHPHLTHSTRPSAGTESTGSLENAVCTVCTQPPIVLPCLPSFLPFDAEESNLGSHGQRV